MKKKFFVSLLIIISIALLVACTEKDRENNEEESVVPVESAKVKQEDLLTERKVYGRLSPSKVTPVLTETIGEVDSLEVKNGDQVKEDDLLMVLKTPAGEYEVKAEKPGEITDLELEAGDIATEEEPLALIVDLDELFINFSVTDHIRSLFESSKTYEMIKDEEQYEVSIQSINSLPDDNGLYTIEGIINNKDLKLLPGMVSMIKLHEEKVKNALLIPSEAIIEDSEGAYVYVIDDDIAVKKEVNIVAVQTDYTAIEGDLEEEDEVIINGQLTVSEGSMVKVAEKENQS